MDDILKSIAQGASPEEAVRAVLDLPEKEQERLIEAVGRLKSGNAAAFLALVYPSLSDKHLQKLAKKAMFLLKTQGVHVEELRPSGESVLHKVETGREATALLSSYDEHLTRLVLVAFEVKRNQFVFNHGALHFSDGLLDLRSVPLTRHELESVVDDYLTRTPPPIVLQPVSAPYIGYLVEEAAGLSGKSVEEGRGLNHILASAKGDVKRPGDIYLLDAEGAVAAPLEAVLTHEIFAPFLLSWPGVEEDKKRLDETAAPGIVLPPYIVEERRQAFLDGLLENERLSRMLAPFKRMLEDYAYLLHGLREYDMYRGLVDVLKDASSVKKVFVHFVRKTLDRMEKKEGEKLPGVIVNPYSVKK